MNAAPTTGHENSPYQPQHAYPVDLADVPPEFVAADRTYGAELQPPDARDRFLAHIALDQYAEFDPAAPRIERERPVQGIGRRGMDTIVGPVVVDRPEGPSVFQEGSGRRTWVERVRDYNERYPALRQREQQESQPRARVISLRRLKMEDPRWQDVKLPGSTTTRTPGLSEQIGMQDRHAVDKSPEAIAQRKAAWKQHEAASSSHPVAVEIAGMTPEPDPGRFRGRLARVLHMEQLTRRWRRGKHAA